VEVLVNFSSAAKQPRLAGLYAEGRIQTSSMASLTIPASSLVQDGDRAYAWRLSNESLQKVALNIGDRDIRSGDYVVKTGLAAGDKVLRHPNTALIDGQKLELSTDAKSGTT
jgi:uncharacterized lipoprotein